MDSNPKRIRSYWIFTLVAIAAISVVILLLFQQFQSSQSSQTTDSSESTSTISFRLKWLIYSGFTPHFVALEKGYYKDEGLIVQIEPGGPGIDPLRLVLTGEADVGLASYDQILLAREKGLPLIAIGEDTVQSGVGFLSLASSGIKTPEDFIGHKVGIMPGTDKGTIYEAMMARLGIDRSQITEIPVQFNLTLLFNGTVDVFPAFISNQPIIAQEAGFEVNIIDPEQYGIHPGGNVFFTSEETLANKRNQLRAFLRAELRAIMDAQLLDDGDAVRCVLKHNEHLNFETEVKIWRATKALLSPHDRNTVGLMKRDTWQHTAELFHASGLLQDIPLLADCYTNKLVEEILQDGL